MKKVIFDVDGVLLSEERYFDVSALTVWEILYSKDYMGLPLEGEDFDARGLWLRPMKSVPAGRKWPLLLTNLRI